MQPVAGIYPSADHSCGQRCVMCLRDCPFRREKPILKNFSEIVKKALDNNKNYKYNVK